MDRQYTDVYLDLEEMVIAGLLEKVTRPDGETGYMLTDLGNQAADMALAEKHGPDATWDDFPETDDDGVFTLDDLTGTSTEDIEALFEKAVPLSEVNYSLQNVEHWPCPECGGMLAIKFKEDPDGGISNYMGCLNCGHGIQPGDLL